MMPLDEAALVAVDETVVQLEIDAAVLRRLLLERGIVLEEVRFLNNSSKRAGRDALKSVLLMTRV